MQKTSWPANLSVTKQIKLARFPPHLPIFDLVISRLLSPYAVLLACLSLPLARADARQVSPKFILSTNDMGTITASLPAAIRRGILARPAYFLDLMARVLDQPPELFVLVDKSHPLPSNYVPPDLVALKEYRLVTTWPHITLRKAIMPAVLEMASAARADEITLTLSSGYRSFEYQQGVYNEEVRLYGRETADRESAHPGFSQHQLGTAMDFGSISDAFGSTAQGRWVAEHAWEYGFSLSYPKGYEEVTGYRHESWHYRYITKEGTLAQREFFGDVQQYFLSFLNENRGLLEKTRIT